MYRAHAAAERASAEGSALLNRRAVHEQPAIVWDRMALSAEKTAARARINLAAKVREANGGKASIQRSCQNSVSPLLFGDAKGIPSAAAPMMRLSGERSTAPSDMSGRSA